MNGVETGHRLWLAKADHDILNIDNNIAAAAVPWDTVCFHAQQAVEKTLKAFLVFRFRPVLRTHDLVALLAACVEVEPSLSILERDCRDLSAFAVGARYPDDIYEPDEEDGRRMIAAMNRVRTAVLRLFPERGAGDLPR